jgi:hypothetical protein
MGGQPALGGCDVRSVKRASQREQRQDAIGRGGSVTLKTLAVVAGFAGVELGGCKKEKPLSAPSRCFGSKFWQR